MISRLIALSVIAAAYAHAGQLSPLADRPEWGSLNDFQKTVTREEFKRLLDEVYAPRNAAQGWITIGEENARITTGDTGFPEWVISFAKDHASSAPAPRYWRYRLELGRETPLGGIRIALDPGHLGGDFARMEERWFQIGVGVPVAEGDLTLAVARRLAERLTKLGAEVLWVRNAPGATTPQRPEHFFDIARRGLEAEGIRKPKERYLSMEEPHRGTTVQSRAELLFYRQAEIRHRAKVVNEVLKPDLVLCLHLNADDWGDPARPSLVSKNHFHLLVNGCYSASEMRLDDNRYEMLLRLLGGATAEEQRISLVLAKSMARRLALPPFIYPQNNAVRIDPSPYVWARNLLANRLYRCPVVFFEPYVMNSQEIWERVQAGDYEGEKLVAGAVRPSLIREYADSVAEGLVSALKAP